MKRHSPVVGRIYSHGPENAEHELKKAYNCVVEAQTTVVIGSTPHPSINQLNEDLVDIYKTAFRAFRNGQRLVAERWARTAKHLARALWHESKIAYLEPRSTNLPFLEGATSTDYNLHEHSDTTEDLLNSVSGHIQSAEGPATRQMRRYLERGREHLAVIDRSDYTHELLRAERIKAAHEYGRVLECMELALEAEHGNKGQKKAS